MGWFTPTRVSPRAGYARSSAGSTYSSSRHGGGGGHHHASTSRYGRSPRDGYVQYLYHKVRHLFHKLMAYAKRHPYKVFFMVIMPLVSGGVLHKLARRFGVNLPEMGQRGWWIGRTRGLHGRSAGDCEWNWWTGQLGQDGAGLHVKWKTRQDKTRQDKTRQDKTRQGTSQKS
ncbi:hypothetical protein K504DRAFT_263518 [Pleomassaria siparia CBS 279.74]|uniref:Uncharacterized protein n=1 Tax=Pleomassaria siparia CBS 279.74 TaxID=1314801 RepID=A0A6G1KD65_9PLEO|nr:hypothetical protein K504DRAFT_263518 [Pleomassaria siparia CBS 279.74]